jgi:hypothetical protein
MVRIFGRRISHGNIQRLGRKVGHKADVIGRKTLNTIDKVAPLASTLALLSGNPAIAQAITSAQGSAHTINDATRSGISALTAKQKNVPMRQEQFANSAGIAKKQIAQFGNDVQTVKEHRNALLRQ